MISDSRFPTPDSRLVEVVAGVLQDASGRILLARRTEGRDLAGLWEFPGGKVEADETPEASLVRELREELGVEVEVGAPLIRVPQQYPHKRLRLDVRRIVSWRGGTPKGREGQALAWVPRQKLSSYAMPSADRPVVASLLQPDRYLVTACPDADRQWLATLQLAIDRGIERVQLRASPAIDPARWRALVLEARTRCRIAGVDVLLNGAIALARELGIGVHLRGAQLRELQQRPLPDDLLVAASCHDLDELRRAEELGCDFVVLGPLQRTPTHPDATGIGWDALATLREHVSLPIYAIGGMTEADIPTARAHGAQGIAAIRALWPTPLV